MTAGAVSDVVAAAPIAFIMGVIVGFVLTQRYRIVRKDGGGEQ